MLTKQQFANMFEDVLDGFGNTLLISGKFEGFNPFDYLIDDVRKQAEQFYNYLNSLDKVNPDSDELFEEFSSFAKSYNTLLCNVDDYYGDDENPMPEGVRTYHKDHLLLKGNYILTSFFNDADNPEELKKNAFDKFVRSFVMYSGLEVVKPEEKKAEQPEQEVQQNVESEVIQETEPEINPEVAAEADPEECANFKKLATILDKAKTFKNSQEYKDLITMCKALGDPETVARMGKNGRKEMLAATGKKINDYISHKAKDGVKPNVFKKFAAVEALSKYLDTKLEPYKNEVINVGEQMDVDVSKLNLDFDQYRQSVPNRQRTVAETTTCPAENFANINPRQGVVQNNMYLATNLLRKVGYEYEMKNIRNMDIARGINSVARMFSDPEFAEAELSGKNMDIEANKKNDGPQNVL